MTLNEVRQAIADIEDEESRLAELKRAYIAIQSLLVPKPETRESASDVSMVKYYLKLMGSEGFTVESLHKEIDALGLDNPPPKPNLSAILSRMAREGKLEVVVQGGGRKASIYRTIPEEPSP